MLAFFLSNGTVMTISSPFASLACFIISFANSPVLPLTICAFFRQNISVDFLSLTNLPPLISGECISWNSFISLVPSGALLNGNSPSPVWLNISLLAHPTLMFVPYCIFPCLPLLICCQYNDYLLLYLITMMFCRLLDVYLRH